jgi:hypothetical protein
MKLSEDRYLILASQLEQETISNRDREKQIQQLNEEVVINGLVWVRFKTNFLNVVNI